MSNKNKNEKALLERPEHTEQNDAAPAQPQSSIPWLIFPPQPASGAGIHDAGTTTAVAGAHDTPTQSLAASAEPQQQISILGPEPREIDFPKFDLARLESMSESERRHDADSMELLALGTFIRPALIGIKLLIQAYRPYVENFMARTAHQGEQRMLKNKKGEPASREEVVREQLGVGVRRVNQLLAATGPEPQKSSKTQLTELQKEVVQAVIGQGYKEKDARSMVKAAEGSDFNTLFRSALSPGPGNPPPPPDSPVPPTPPDPAPVVVVDPPFGGDQGGEEKLDDEAESAGPPPRAVDPPVVEPSVIGGEESAPEVDPQIAELEQLKQERAELQKQLELAKAENASLLQRLEALSVVPESVKDNQITASLAAEPDTLQAGERLKMYFNTVGQRVLPPNMELGIVSVSVRIVGRSSRIISGDYLEKRNTSQPPNLCKCSVEVSEAGRQKVSEWGTGGWGKAYVVYSSDETNLRVITQEAAQELAPEAFEPTKKSPVGL